MSPKKILVVDDNPAVARTLKRMLEKGGYDVQAVTDAEEGLAMAKGLTPAAILLDMEMPGSDGVSVLSDLRASEKTSSIPVIVITGHTKGEVVEKVSLGSIAECLTKPIDIAVLLSTLQHVLQARRHTKSV